MQDAQVQKKMKNFHSNVISKAIWSSQCWSFTRILGRKVRWVGEYLIRSLDIWQFSPIKSDPRSYNKAVNFFLIQKTVLNIQGYFCWMPAHRLPLETSSCKKIKVFVKIAKERTGHGQSISTTDRNRNKCHGGMENAFPPWTMVLAREKLCAQIMYIR